MTDMQVIPAALDTKLEAAARTLIDRGPLTNADADELIRCVRRHQALLSWRGLDAPWNFTHHAPVDRTLSG